MFGFFEPSNGKTYVYGQIGSNHIRRKVELLRSNFRSGTIRGRDARVSRTV